MMRSVARSPKCQAFGRERQTSKSGKAAAAAATTTTTAAAAAAAAATTTCHVVLPSHRQALGNTTVHCYQKAQPKERLDAIVWQHTSINERVNE
jgi:hypothetical protein